MGRGNPSPIRANLGHKSVTYIHHAAWFDEENNTWHTSAEYENLFNHLRAGKSYDIKSISGKMVEIILDSGGKFHQKSDNSGFFIEFSNQEELALFLLRWS